MAYLIFLIMFHLGFRLEREFELVLEQWSTQMFSKNLNWEFLAMCSNGEEIKSKLNNS